MNLVFHKIESRRKKPASVIAALSPAKKRELCYNVIGTARTNGSLIDQPCCVCGARKAHAHHETYDDPYTITFLCPSHHRLRHVELGWGCRNKATPSPLSNCAIFTVSISESLAKRMDQRVKQLGMSRSEYVRHLIRQEAAAQKTATKEAKTKAATYRNANAS